MSPFKKVVAAKPQPLYGTDGPLYGSDGPLYGTDEPLYGSDDPAAVAARQRKARQVGQQRLLMSRLKEMQRMQFGQPPVLRYPPLRQAGQPSSMFSWGPGFGQWPSAANPPASGMGMFGNWGMGRSPFGGSFPSTGNMAQNERGYPLPTLTVRGTTILPQEYPQYIKFPNNEPYVISSNQMRGWSANKNYNLFHEFEYGKGPTNRLFLDDHPMTIDMKSAYGVQQARRLYYNKYLSSSLTSGRVNNNASVENYNAGFGFMDVMRAGSNITEQYVGNYRIDIFTSKDGSTLFFILSDRKTMPSLYYHLPFVKGKERVPGIRTPEGNQYQIYMWSERNAAHLESAQR